MTIDANTSYIPWADCRKVPPVNVRLRVMRKYESEEQEFYGVGKSVRKLKKHIREFQPETPQEVIDLFNERLAEMEARRAELRIKLGKGNHND
jgi:hypothetical protein